MSKSGHTAVLDGNHFTLYWDYKGSPMQMIFAKEGTADADRQLYVTQVNIEPSSPSTTPAEEPPKATQETTNNTVNIGNLTGTWSNVGVYYNGNRMDPDDLEFFNCYLTFNSDGSYVLSINDTKRNGIYEVYDGSISLSSSMGELNGSMSGGEIIIKDAYDIGGRYYDFAFSK